MLPCYIIVQFVDLMLRTLDAYLNLRRLDMRFPHLRERLREYAIALDRINEKRGGKKFFSQC